MLSLANCASPPPSPCSRVHQPHLDPGLPAPKARAALPPPPCLSTHLGSSRHAVLPQAWLCGPLAFCLPSHSLADEALQTWADGSSPREPGLALQMDTVTGSFLDSGPLFWRPPLTFGSGRWVPGRLAGPRASVCPGQGLPTPTQPAWAGSMAQSHGQGVWPLSPVACGPRLHGPSAGFRSAP